MFHLQANVAQHYFEASALAAETFQVVDFVGEEHISRPFEFAVNLVSDDPEIRFADVINQPATLATLRGEERVPVHGLVADFRQGGRTADRFGYRAVLVPRLWQLSLTFQSRIFQHMTVDAIVGQVLEAAGLTGQDFRFDLTGSYPEREYCVQYQETDLAFISRLLEHEGIHFFFAHEDRDVLVMTDARSGNPRIPGADAVTYNAGAGMAPGAEAVREFVCREQVVTGKVLLKDYNYRTPETNLQAESQLNGEMPGLRYEYGQHFADQGEGDRLAQVRNEEIECQRRLLLGEGTCAGLRSGHVFTLEDHYRSDLNDDYLITRVRHIGTQGASLPGLSEMENGEASVYRNEFTGVPADGPYRPPRLTPVPHVPGIMTARTETAGGDYAYLDEEGRYHAKMHFDASEVTDGEATRPIRMNQPYSGPDYGIHFPNHADTEAVWACVNGNPDRPIALGTVPNLSQNAPSVASNKTQNVIRTYAGNQILLEDEEGVTKIALTTPGGHSISLDDGGPHITASTSGGHVLMMDDDGKCASLRTTDGHELMMSDDGKRVFLHTTDGHGLNMEDEVKTILLYSKEGHSLSMDDPNKSYTLQTIDGHTLLMHDTNKQVRLYSTDGHELILSDADNAIEVKTKSEENKVTLHEGPGAITVEAKNQITLVTGESKLEMNKDGTIVLSGKSITILGDDEVKASGKKVEATGQQEAKMGVGTQSVTCNNQKVETSGAGITAAAVGVHEVTGAMVKIN